jgi:hypothetical protein
MPVHPRSYNPNVNNAVPLSNYRAPVIEGQEGGSSSASASDCKNGETEHAYTHKLPQTYDQMHTIAPSGQLLDRSKQELKIWNEMAKLYHKIEKTAAGEIDSESEEEEPAGGGEQRGSGSGNGDGSSAHMSSMEGHTSSQPRQRSELVRVPHGMGTRYVKVPKKMMGSNNNDKGKGKGKGKVGSSSNSSSNNSSSSNKTRGGRKTQVQAPVRGKIITSSPIKKKKGKGKGKGKGRVRMRTTSTSTTASTTRKTDPYAPMTIPASTSLPKQVC